MGEHIDFIQRPFLGTPARAEWHAFLVTERRRTPLLARPEFLGWVLDEASPDDARAVLAELPPPGRLAYRYVIGPRYRSTRDDRPVAAAAEAG